MEGAILDLCCACISDRFYLAAKGRPGRFRETPHDPARTVYFKMNDHPRSIVSLPILFLFLFLLVCCLPQAMAAPLAASSPARITREGQARFRELDLSRLPPGTPPRLFSAIVSGSTFDVFAREVPAGPLMIELGFVDTVSNGPGQNTFAVDANGTPLDANLDVWSRAGGAYKPWVMKTTFSHSGGALAIHLTGLGKPAFISYARITDPQGNELAFGNAKDWMKSERLTLLDSRSRPFHIVKVGEVPFFDVDHSPVGAWSTFIYGMEASGGVQVCKQPGGDGTLVPDQGVIVAVKNGAMERVMPFTSKQKSLPAGALVTDREVTRALGACTDSWRVPMGVSWVHYTPVWPMKDWDTATLEEKRRFVLPVTWMRFTIDNRAGARETQLLFSLQQAAQRAQGLPGFDGYVVDQNSTIAVKSGDAELLTADQVKEAFGLDGATSAFLRARGPRYSESSDLLHRSLQGRDRGAVRGLTAKNDVRCFIFKSERHPENRRKQSSRCHRGVWSDGQQAGRLRTG